MTELLATMDLNEVAASLRRLDELIAADMVVIPLYQPLSGTVYALYTVAGVDTPSGGLPFTGRPRLFVRVNAQTKSLSVDEQLT